eukprot:jgi/Mesvir1/24226/Mv10937-RA.1
MATKGDNNGSPGSYNLPPLNLSKLPTVQLPNEPPQQVVHKWTPRPLGGISDRASTQTAGPVQPRLPAPRCPDGDVASPTSSSGTPRAHGLRVAQHIMALPEQDPKAPVEPAALSPRLAPLSGPFTERGTLATKGERAGASRQKDKLDLSSPPSHTKVSTDVSLGAATFRRSVGDTLNSNQSAAAFYTFPIQTVEEFCGTAKRQTAWKNASPRQQPKEPTAKILLTDYLRRYEQEQVGCVSEALFMELKYSEATRLSQGADMPNRFRAGVSCHILQKVVQHSEYFGPILQSILKDVLRCIYMDAFDGGDVPVLNEQTLVKAKPYFEEVMAAKAILDNAKQREAEVVREKAKLVRDTVVEGKYFRKQAAVYSMLLMGQMFRRWHSSWKERAEHKARLKRFFLRQMRSTALLHDVFKAWRTECRAAKSEAASQGLTARIRQLEEQLHEALHRNEELSVELSAMTQELEIVRAIAQPVIPGRRGSIDDPDLLRAVSSSAKDAAGFSTVASAARKLSLQNGITPPNSRRGTLKSYVPGGPPGLGRGGLVPALLAGEQMELITALTGLVDVLGNTLLESLDTWTQFAQSLPNTQRLSEKLVTRSDAHAEIVRLLQSDEFRVPGTGIPGVDWDPGILSNLLRKISGGKLGKRKRKRPDAEAEAGAGPGDGSEEHADARAKAEGEGKGEGEGEGDGLDSRQLSQGESVQSSEEGRGTSDDGRRTSEDGAVLAASPRHREPSRLSIMGREGEDPLELGHAVRRKSLLGMLTDGGNEPPAVGGEPGDVLLTHPSSDLHGQKDGEGGPDEGHKSAHRVGFQGNPSGGPSEVDLHEGPRPEDRQDAARRRRVAKEEEKRRQEEEEDDEDDEDDEDEDYMVDDWDTKEASPLMLLQEKEQIEDACIQLDISSKQDRTGVTSGRKVGRGFTWMALELAACRMRMEECDRKDINELLMTWVNFHLSNAPSHFKPFGHVKMENFKDSLRDGYIYAVLLPSICERVAQDLEDGFYSAPSEVDPQRRCEQVLQATKYIGENCAAFIGVNNILNGDAELNTAFLARLLATHSALPTGIPKYIVNMSGVDELKNNWKAVQRLLRRCKQAAEKGAAPGSGAELVQELTAINKEISAVSVGFSVCSKLVFSVWATAREGFQSWRTLLARAHGRIWTVFSARLRGKRLEDVMDAAELREMRSFCKLSEARLRAAFKGTDINFGLETLKVEEVLQVNFESLRGIFRHYSITIGTGSSAVSVITSAQYWRLLKDTHIATSALQGHVYDTIFKQLARAEIPSSGVGKTPPKGAAGSTRSNGLGPGDFVDALLRIAHLKYNDWDMFPCDQVRALLQDKVVRNAYQNTADLFRSQLSTEEVQTVFKEHRTKLIKVFKHFAANDKNDFDHNESMNVAEFTQLLRAGGLMDTNLTQLMVAKIFSGIQQDEAGGGDAEGGSDGGGAGGASEMVYSEFLEAIAAVAMFRVCDPFIPMPTRLNTFISEVFLPPLLKAMKK